MPMPTRRRLLAAATAAAAAATFARLPAIAQGSPPPGSGPSGSGPSGSRPPGSPFTLPELPYDVTALEPHIDARTMGLHHGKHHQTYVTNLNNALAEHSQLHGLSLTDLLKRLGELPEGIRTAVRDNGGGHANHSMFWTIMGPNGGGEPTGAVGEAIARDFGAFEDFKKTFNEAGTKQFGSGWVFVTADTEGKLEIVARPNQDTPLMDGKPVLMGNDVWEHAYYLTYQNRRADYLAAWWNTVNWGAVNQRLAAIRQGGSVL
ncbi:superoxide dismutase [Rhodocista pekingensis]|uniref:Superoxide dismutase n=1 Tax=Rhodocista pekingensis TaxID=201185 RepID=A0ABW2KZ76_9PROT